MKNFLATSLRFVLAVVILVSSLPYLGNAEILDPAANNPLLRRIADDLHRNGIDVMQDWHSEVPVNKRPVVAPLANYQISLIPKEENWVREFNKGVMGAIAAIKSSENIARDALAKKWTSTPKAQRVFISFAREDVAYARTVKAALEAQGYVAFIYINEPGRSPVQSPVVLGEYLRTAGTHLVIDTDVARRKSGVLAEALAFARYKRPRSDGPGSVATRNPKPSVSGGGGGAGSASATKRHVVEIYGAKKRCPRTRQAIELFKQAGVEVKYYDVDASPRAYKVVEKNSQWLEHDLLPFIRLDGKPVRANSTGITKALMACENPISMP